MTGVQTCALPISLICDPYSNMVMLDDKGIDYETSDNWDVFLIQWNQAIKEYHKNIELYQRVNLPPLFHITSALEFFLGKHSFDLRLIQTSKDKIEPVLCDVSKIQDKECEYIITRQMYNKFAIFLQRINNITDKNQIHPDGVGAKKMLIDDMRDEMKRKHRKDDGDTFGDYIGKLMKATCCCGNGAVSVFDVNKMKIYQLISGFSMFVKKSNSDRLLNGQFNLDKVSKKELNWFE